MSEEQRVPNKTSPATENKDYVALKDYCKEANAKRLERYNNRRKATPLAPACSTKIKDGKDSTDFSLDADNLVALLDACGTTAADFAIELANDLKRTICFTAGENERGTINAGLATLAGVAPTDEIEAMLAAQMVATHKAGMRMLGCAMRAETLNVGQWQSGFAVKLLRTYTMQMDALQRYRGKGQQKMTVEHVHVHAGGQAIVGAVTGGGGVQQKTEEQPHAKQIESQSSTYSPMPPLSCANKEREPVPVTRDAKR